jgi:hypothetical protein
MFDIELKDIMIEKILIKILYDYYRIELFDCFLCATLYPFVISFVNNESEFSEIIQLDNYDHDTETYYLKTNGKTISIDYEHERGSCEVCRNVTNETNIVVDIETLTTALVHTNYGINTLLDYTYDELQKIKHDHSSHPLLWYYDPNVYKRDIIGRYQKSKYYFHKYFESIEYKLLSNIDPTWCEGIFGLLNSIGWKPSQEILE